ncbi:acyl-CoA dehydrogenase family protein [Streptomyces globisporus]|uniref:Acyl-CoA dehydrogenase n=1 Tax=Streptomyces globisporus TaxID=1908 RepID=A0ABN8UTE0_STRGL|nr:MULTISPECIES: acyl-CoA dehydrogenase family protein [Streptomyces]WSF76465.1 acyl-CoA dehydrogenase family protein [Streptomyces globisporus]WSU80912.1 acyl-CoA dehydrogenase family protein [Streptomyces globisporus]GGV98992.1 acyl-CoA dehydrogenase [Streptomyces globisporus]CAH9413487.1 Acyl-CoA dehydrogenase [Streptomyces globisporus]
MPRPPNAPPDDLFTLMTPWAERLNTDLDALDREAEFSHEKWSAVRESGILRTPFDTEHGGHGRSLTDTMRVLEGLGHVSRDSGLSFSTSTQMVSVGVPLQRFGSAELKGRHLPGILSGETITAHAITEESGGSDAMNTATTAVRDGDHYVVDGGKMFITNAPVAGLFLLYVRTGDPGPFGLTCLLVEAGTPGLTVGPAMDKIGLRTSPIGTLDFRGLRVPVAQRVGKEGAGFLVLDYVMKREVLFAFSITLGEMTRRLEETIAFARKREQFGKPIGSYQAVSHKIANMSIEVETARKWLRDTGAKVEERQDASLDLASTKTVVSEANVRTALDAVQIHGGRGVLTAHGVERDLRNSIAGTIYSGTSEIQRNRIAALLGL